MADADGISAAGYSAELMADDGSLYCLDGALLSLQWEERISELAQRATLALANMAVGGTWLMALAKPGCPLRIYAGAGGGAPGPVFDGAVWEWQYSSARNKELRLTAYDPMVRLQQSKDFRHYPAGMETRAILGDICGAWGVPLDYRWRQGMAHGKKIFNGVAVGDMAIELLEEARRQSGEKYAAYCAGGKLVVDGYGTNADVPRFDASSALSTMDRLSLSRLVTRVKVFGNEDREGRPAFEDAVDGDTRHGVLQEAVRRDSNKSLGEARAEALALLKDRGRPEELIQASVPDVPSLRKGHLVEMAAGNLLGRFYVEGVTHHADRRLMSLELSREAAAPS